MNELQPRRASIQRFPRPPGADAEWLADHYFDWLHEKVWVADARRVPRGAHLWFVPFGSPAIELVETVRSPRRVAFDVEAGWLVDGPRGGTFEFRIVEDEVAEIALVGFAPSLPRWIYSITQAVVHDIVMRAFVRHLRTLERAQLTDGTSEGAT